MNKKLLISVAALLGLATILTSFESYEHSAMATLETTAPAFSAEAKGLNVTAKKYTSSESKEYLDRNLMSSGYQPIQITIQNNTGDTYNFSKEGVSLPNASASKVAFAVGKKGLPRAIGLKVASLFFWPFMIPDTLNGIHAAKSHYKMRKDYGAKIVKEKDEEIAPYSTFHRVIFVPNDEVRETLTVTLLSKGDKTPLSFINTIKDVEEKVILDKIE